MVFNKRDLFDYVENAPIGLHCVDKEGIIVWANKVELDMLGYPTEEYIGQPMRDFYADPAQADQILESLKNQEILNQYESALLCKNGSIKTVLMNSNLLWKESEFIYSLCFTIVATRRDAQSRTLKESEEQSRELMQRLPVAVYTCDTEGRITSYNEAAAELWGRRPVIGTDFWCGSWMIFNPDGSSLPIDKCPMAVCLKEKRPVRGQEIIVARPDGSKRSVLSHPEPIIDSSGNAAGAVNTLVDLTQVKLADEYLSQSEKKYRELACSLENEIKNRTSELETINEKLKKSEERYHKMIDEVEDYAIILLNKDGIIQNWNKGAEKIKGYKEEEIVGKSFKLFYLPQEQITGLPEKLIREATIKGKALHEGWRVRKDGSTFWGSVVITCIHDKNDDIIGFSKVTRDLTERKIAEDKEKMYIRELEFQNKELREFAYVASHDLKEPLRKIIFYNNFINERSAAQLSEKEASYLSRSMVAAKRMQLLIDDLLNYSSTNNPDQNFELVELDEILKEIISDLKEHNDDAAVIIHRSHLPAINAIGFQMKQLLNNLIGNALKYQYPGRTPEIWITSEKVKAGELKVNRELAFDCYYKISVIDNGIGFDNAYAEKIFELFQRLNERTVFAGTGIGLTICRKIAENHNGFITASGNPGEGAIFNIYFPIPNVAKYPHLNLQKPLSELSDTYSPAIS